MIKTFEMRDRERPLDVYGPPGLKALFQQVLRAVIGRTKYPLDVIELEHHEEVRFDDFVIAPSRSATASRPTATRSSRTTGPGRFDVEAARALGVTEGPDFGRLQRGETVNGVTPEQVVGEDRPGRRIVYTGDTSPVPVRRGLRPRGRSAGARGDVLRGGQARARARPATRPPPRPPAPRATPGVKLLALTHLSTRYFPREIRKEARGGLREHGRPARLRHDRGPVPGAWRAAPGQAGAAEAAP